MALRGLSGAQLSALKDVPHHLDRAVDFSESRPNETTTHHLTIVFEIPDELDERITQELEKLKLRR